MNPDDAYTAELERSLEALRARPAHDPELSRVRDSFAICYRNHGQRDRAAALYAEVRVCEHLEPVRQYLLERFALPEFVIAHVHRGTHDGAEQGLVCNVHHDGLMGAHPDVASASRVIG